MGSSVVTAITDLEAMRGEWDALSALARLPMLDHDWVLSCVEAFHDERDLRVVVTRERGTLTGVAPLVLEARGSGRHLVLAGATLLYEHGSWLYSSEEALSDLVTAVLRLGKPVQLHRIPRACRLADVLSVLPRSRGLSLARSAAPSLAITTCGTWSEYCSGLSRRTLRKFTEGLADAERALGPARVDELQPSPECVRPLLEVFTDLEASGWKGRRGSSIGQREDLTRFFENYCSRVAERRQLRVTKLSFGSQLAAAEISLDAYGRRWGLKIAYREALAAHSPGLHLIHASIRAAVERGLAAYEFLGSAADWQRRWQPETREYLMLLLYPWSLAGLHGACRDAGIAFWRRAAKI